MIVNKDQLTHKVKNERKLQNRNTLKSQEELEPKHKFRHRKLGLTSAIIAALLLGAAVGVGIHMAQKSEYLNSHLNPYVNEYLNQYVVDGILYLGGQIFLRLMQMLVVPLVFFSISCGASAMGDTKEVGKVGVKTFVFYLATTVVAISIALLLALMINPGIGLNLADVQAQEVTVGQTSSLADTILNIFPKNPVKALADGEMLQIIFFALAVGIVLAKLGERAGVVSEFFAQTNLIMMEMTAVFMKAAPVGVFCLVARTFSQIGFEAFLPMLKYMWTVLLALLVHCFGVYPALLAAFARLSPITFFRKYFSVMAFAFSTASSSSTIPMAIETLDEKMGVSQRISSFTIPLGATINMDGTAIMQGAAVVFTAQAFGIELGWQGYLTVIATATLASIGTATVPSAGLITLSMVFTSVGLPIEGIALIMGIDRILDMTRTAVNVAGDAVCTLIVAKRSGLLDERVY